MSPELCRSILCLTTESKTLLRFIQRQPARAGRAHAIAYTGIAPSPHACRNNYNLPCNFNMVLVSCALSLVVRDNPTLIYLEG